MNTEQHFDSIAKTTHIVMPEDHMEELYSSPNFLVRFVHTQRLDAFVRLLPQGRKNVLDAGCGEGQLIERMKRASPDSRYVGVDVTEVALVKAHKRCPFASFHKADITSLPFKDGTFDVIVCTEVIEHVPEYRDVLLELARVLKPGGLLLISFPNETLWTIARLLLGRRPIKVPDHVNSFTPRRMRKVMPLSYSSRRNLPFGLPFCLSLNGLMVFRKKGRIVRKLVGG